jgi:hypothetical protein
MSEAVGERSSSKPQIFGIEHGATPVVLKLSTSLSENTGKHKIHLEARAPSNHF